MDEPINEQQVKHVNPRDAFRFFAASETMNLPTMYASGGPLSPRVVTVVARNCDRSFPIERLDEAFALYRTMLAELGYLDEGTGEEG